MSIKRCDDLGHVAPFLPKKPSKFVISSSIRASSASPGDPTGTSPAWASGQSPGHATSALNCSGVGHAKGAKPYPC
ncbi:hypothetical protein JHK86_004468 [Glycine max]|nr:hypothetical protein JHK86_004468 [Glycine max]